MRPNPAERKIRQPKCYLGFIFICPLFMFRARAIYMQFLKEDKLAEIVIDLDKLKENRLDESWLAMFGYHIKSILT
jgi:hypothetical protein